MPYVLENYILIFKNALKNPFFLVGVNFQKMIFHFGSTKTKEHVS
jgi:hypothetical protein